MAEQSAVDYVGGDRLAVDLHHRPLGAQRRGVDGAGECFLAGPRFTDNQDRQAVAGGLGGDREGRSEVGRGAHQLLKRKIGGQLFGQGGQLASGTAAIAVGAERFEQTFRCDGLGEEVACPGTHGVDCQRDRAAVGKDETGRSGRTARMAAMSSARDRRVRCDINAARTSRPWGPCSRVAAIRRCRR